MVALSQPVRARGETVKILCLFRSRPQPNPCVPRRALRAVTVLLLVAGAVAADPREDAFRTPPSEARPLTWWHWLNGNITKGGITRDLESIKQAGLGGCYLFNCGGKHPAGDVRFMQPRWLEMMDHTVREAERLGLKFGVHNCDGFSQSGGPWITPETSMKEMTWTAVDAEGPKAFDGVLAQPETKEGFYRDIAIVAFPLPDGGPLFGAALRGTIPERDLARLVDGDEKTQAPFPVPAVENTVDFVFPESRVLRSLTVRRFAPHRWEEDFPIRLDASDDGQSFRSVGEFTANWDFAGGVGATAAFADATGRVFRVAFRNPIRIQIGEIEISDAVRIHFAEAKAARLSSRGHGAETRHHRAYPGPDRNRPLAPGLVVAKDAVLDLTKRMDADGRLKWDVPAGRWRILRVGFTSNGHYVAPATEEGRGLECDKLDPAAVRFHLDQYVGKLLERAGPAAGRTFAAVEIDSWECGIQNWTAGFERRFRERVGYDLFPFFPALLEGWVVGDVDQTERVLWDWRRFLADQFSESYFATAAAYLKGKGIAYVGESTGRQQYLYDVAYIRNSEVTMGEFWIDAGAGQGVRVDNKVASSIAHVAGKPIVASESYTASPGAARWQNHPFSLKAEGDRAFCAGVNQFVFHTFAHQPYEVIGPGFTFFFWGLNFNRGNTWWGEAKAWIDYLARCNHMLRQGQQVCDVLWFVGEDVPNRIAWRDELRPALPAGYDFDGGDVRALMEAGVKDGRVALPSGAEYRVLLLPDLPTMRPEAARKALGLARAGATVLAPRRPTQSPAFCDRGAGDEAAGESLAELWGDAHDGAEVDRRIGKGRFFAGLSFEEVFRRIGLAADFEYRAPAEDAEVLYVHRRAGGADAWLVSNQLNRPERLEAVFRAGDKEPELWDPSTGAISRPGVFRRETDGRTAVPMRLDPHGSVFVVFREAPAAPHAVALEGPTPVRADTPVAPEPPVGLKEAAGTFTLALWVRSAEDIPLPPERRTEIAFQKQNWAIFPPQGQAIFGDGHAGAGVAAGRNGVVVFEHSARYAPAVVTFPADLTERTHVALVYRAGVPTLFVNGREVRTGTKGPHMVHASPGGGPAFRGERSAPLLFNRALTAAEIAALAQARPLPSATPPPVELERTGDGKLLARFWEPLERTVLLDGGARVRLAPPAVPVPLPLEGPWSVTFPPGLGAPPAAEFEKLVSWPDRPEPGIRFFSGTATYAKTFDLPASLVGADRELWLDLGAVEVIARATLNGKELPTLWKPPFRTRIDDAAQPGANRLEVRVTNLWPNRMIGDAALPDDVEWQPAAKGSELPAKWPDWLLNGTPRPSGRIAFCTRGNVYAKNDPLLPSGLLGPVLIRSAVLVPVDSRTAIAPERSR